MMTPAPIRTVGQAEKYYERDDYYRGEESRPAHWHGKGARELGLRGEIQPADYAKVIRGVLPDGRELPKPPPGKDGKERNRMPGYDLAFSAPKSLSIEALVYGDHRLIDAHDKAVKASLNWLEEHGATARKSVHGRSRYEKTGNLVASIYRHYTARPVDGKVDPALHDHVLVWNMTQRSDGEWVSIGDNSTWYRLQYAASEVYRTELASLVKPLGYELVRTNEKDGRWELAHYTPDHIRGFSRRGQQVEAKYRELQELKEKGEGFEDAPRSKLRQIAASKSKEPKLNQPLEEVRAEQRVRAHELGVDDAHSAIQRDMPANIARMESISREEVRERAEEAVRFAIDHLTEKTSVFERAYLTQHAMVHAQGVCSAADVERVVKRLESRHELIHDELREKYTTKAALALENATLEIVKDGRDTVEPIMSREEANSRLERYCDVMEEERGFRLNPGQFESGVAALSSSDFARGIQGASGAGKTTLMAALAEAAADCPIALVGLSPGAAQARILEEESGIASQTVASYVNQRRSTKGNPRLLIVDESSMLSTREFLKLAYKARREGDRLLLVGDRNQLAAVDAGKPFAELCDRVMRFTVMDENVRQREAPVVRDAVAATVDRDHSRSVELVAHRVYQHPSSTVRLRESVDQYMKRDPEARQATLITTLTRADREELNSTLRDELRSEGTLRGVRRQTTVLVKRDLTDAERGDARSYRVGDVLEFHKRYRRLGVESGERLEVVGLDEQTRTLTIRGADGREIQWQPHRVHGHKKMTAHERQSREIQAGDLIRWTDNDYSHDRRTNELATVIKVRKGVAQLRLASGKEQELDLSVDGKWDYGWASTLHAIQGRTAKSILAHMPSRSRLTGSEAWLVALSRVKTEDVRIFTDDLKQLPKSVSVSRAQVSAIEFVEQQKAQDLYAFAEEIKAADHAAQKAMEISAEVSQPPMPSLREWRMSGTAASIDHLRDLMLRGYRVVSVAETPWQVDALRAAHPYLEHRSLEEAVQDAQIEPVNQPEIYVAWASESQYPSLREDFANVVKMLADRRHAAGIFQMDSTPTQALEEMRQQELGRSLDSDRQPKHDKDWGMYR